ncbi:MAG: hypothetical protein Q9210_005140 [Variospora velana]
MSDNSQALTASSPSFPFLRLPPEIRCAIYKLVLPTSSRIAPPLSGPATTRSPYALARVSRLIRDEYSKLFYANVALVIEVKADVAATVVPAYYHWLRTIDESLMARVKNLIVCNGSPSRKCWELPTMPGIQFGAGNVGEGGFATVEDVVAILDTLDTCGIKVIDTAALYPNPAIGASERLLGAAKAHHRGFIINTKMMITADGPGKGSLKKEAINESIPRSLSALCVPNVNVLYCHVPDTITPVDETAAALHDHWRKGHFKQLGLSKYSAAQVEEFLSTCEKNGWKKPTVYTGQYNAVCRGMEKDLLPLLRRHGIAYVAYSPLASGFLTGNLSLGNDLTGTRFGEGHYIGAFYRPMYDKPAMHAAIQELHAFLEPRGVTMAEAALRWLFHHSALGPDDALILGATKLAQIESNMSQIKKGPLTEETVEMFDKTWDKYSDESLKDHLPVVWKDE